MTEIPDGGFRLWWRGPPSYGEKLSADFTCLDDALTHAAILFARDDIENFLRLENWMGEDACPPDQLLPIAKLRTKAALDQHDEQAMEASPQWGSFA